MSLVDRLLDFFKRKTTVAEGGGDKAIQKQIAMGKMTARQRIEALLDNGTFQEYDLFVEHKAEDFGMDKTSILKLKDLDKRLKVFRKYISL